jgi:hypothetical protein
MRLATTVFLSHKTKPNPWYERWVNVLAYTARMNSPSTPLTVYKVGDNDEDLTSIQREKIYIGNTRKTRHHCDVVNAAQDGEILGLLDADTFITRDMSSAEQLLDNAEADFAYCLRSKEGGYLTNTGVVFVRVSQKTKLMYQQWLKVAIRMLKDKQFHHEYKSLYGGINQSSLGYLCSEWVGANEIKTLELQCKEWNCGPCSYHLFNHLNTKVVHLLGDLRAEIAGVRNLSTKERDPRTLNIRYLAERWKRYEVQSKKLGRRILA